MPFGYMSEETARNIQETHDGVIRLEQWVKGATKLYDGKHADCVKDHECTRKKVKDLGEKIDRHAFGGMRFVLWVVGLCVTAGVSAAALYFGLAGNKGG